MAASSKLSNSISARKAFIPTSRLRIEDDNKHLIEDDDNLLIGDDDELLIEGDDNLEEN